MSDAVSLGRQFLVGRDVSRFVQRRRFRDRDIEQWLRRSTTRCFQGDA